MLSATLVAAAPATVGRLVNEHLAVEVRADGRFDVRDLRNQRLYAQPGPGAGPVNVLPAAPKDFALDGDLAEWTGEPHRISSGMLGDARQVDSDADCSAVFHIGRRSGKLCLAVRVRDDVPDFGPAENPWEQDSIEFWVEHQQYNLTLVNGKAVLRQMKGASGARERRAVMRKLTDGYVAEIELTGLGDDSGFRFAFSVNDSDGGAKRQAQISWPRGYRHGDVSTAANFTRPGIEAASPEVRQGDGTLELKRRLGGLSTTIKFALEGDTLAVEIGAAPVHTMGASIAYPHPTRFDAPNGYWMVPHASGLAYRVRGDNFRWPGTWGHSMPVFAAVDPDGGGGFLAIIETPFDATMRQARTEDRARSISVSWNATLGKFGYARRVSYHFLPRGTLMDAAKRYRDHVRARGMWVGFAEKVKERPRIERFISAGAEFYGNRTVFAALHQLGVRRLLAEGGSREETSYGFLPSRYDIYTDVYDPSEREEWGKSHPSYWSTRNPGFQFPDDVIKNRDGTLKRGGPVITNPRTGKKAICYRPNQRVALDVLKREDRGTGIIKRLGLEAYFIDVTTAMLLHEDYDPNHTCSRAEDAKWRREQFKYLRDLGMVVGSEFGRDWGMPHADWFLGLAGPGMYGFQRGIGGGTSGGMGDVPVDVNVRGYSEATFSLARRAPMFELVYHGACRCTHWWGDHPLIMPDVWHKRDLVHLLLDDMEVYRLSSQYARTCFWLNIDRVVSSCNLLGAWGEAVGYDHITDYAVLDKAGSAARVTYSGGLSMTVNIGDTPVQTSEGAELPAYAYLIAGKSSRMPSLPVGRPVVVAPGWKPLDGWFDVKALGYLAGWSVPAGVRLEADRNNLRPGSTKNMPGWPLASARIKGRAPKSGLVLESRPFRVLDGWTYSLGAWVRTETPCQVVFALEPEGNVTAAVSKPVQATAAWQQVKWGAAIPADVDRARLVVRVPKATSVVTLNVDDFSVRPSRPVPPLALPHHFTFDTDTMSWTGTSGVKCSVVRERPHAGSGCLRVAGENKSSWSLAASKGFVLPPGARIRVSAWMRVERYEPADRPPFLKCGFDRTAGGHLRNESTSRYDLKRRGTWQRLEGIFRVPAEPTKCHMAVEKGGTHPVTAELCLDDVMLEGVE